MKLTFLVMLLVIISAVSWVLEKAGKLGKVRLYVYPYVRHSYVICFREWIHSLSAEPSLLKRLPGRFLGYLFDHSLGRFF